MAMADVRIDMETALYEQMAALCAKLGTTVEATAVRFCEEFVRTETPRFSSPVERFSSVRIFSANGYASLSRENTNASEPEADVISDAFACRLMK